MTAIRATLADIKCASETMMSALPALALSANTGAVTALANDYRYEDIFSRQVRALGRPARRTWAGAPYSSAAAQPGAEFDGLSTKECK